MSGNTRGTSVDTAKSAQGLLNEREVAAYLKLSVKTLQLWRYQGSGPPYVKFGRAVRYSKDGLAAFVDAHEVRPTEIPGRTAR